MRFGKNRESGGEGKLPLTPMIDIVFQLLIFFIVSTKFRVPEGELEAYLPRDEGAPTKRTERPEDVKEIRVTLRVSQAGANNPNVPPTILIDNTEVKEKTGGNSMTWLRDKLKRYGRDKATLEKLPVIIEAGPELAYKWVIGTLDMCRSIGFAKVNFAASKRNAPPPDAASGDRPPG